MTRSQGTRISITRSPRRAVGGRPISSKEPLGRFCPESAHRHLPGESGLIIPLLAAILVTCFVMAGVAIDAGNLFRASLVLQKAVDAAAVAAAKTVAVVGKAEQYADEAGFKQRVREDAWSMMRANLAFHVNDPAVVDAIVESTKVVDSGGGFIAPGVDIAYQDTVELTATWEVPLLLLRYFPGFASQRTVQAHAKAQVQPTMLALILDSSNSMLCPALASNDCTCAPYCTPGERKIDYLRNAVLAFLTQFNDKRDVVGVTFFAYSAKTVLDMKTNDPDICPSASASASCGFTWNDFLPTDPAAVPLLDSAFIQGGTNPGEGLLAAFTSSAAARAAQNRQNVALILATDGAPSAALFDFAHPTNLPPNAVMGGQYSYYSWAADYESDFSSLVASSVMELVQAPLPTWHWSHVTPPGPGTPGDPPPDKRVNCSLPFSWRLSSLPAPYNEVSNYDYLRDNPERAFQNCLGDFAFKRPDGVVVGGTVPFTQFREQYAHYAIAMADFVRDQGGLVYAIGVGQPAAIGADPYQDAANFRLRKDIFLARLANDSKSDTYARFPAEFADYVAPGDDYRSQGSYLAADNATDLTRLFSDLHDRLVRKIKTIQLIS